MRTTWIVHAKSDLDYFLLVLENNLFFLCCILSSLAALKYKLMPGDNADAKL